MQYEIRGDLKAVRAIVDAGVELPVWAMGAIWRWFADQEFSLPIAKMELEADERRALSLAIIDEMQEVFAELEEGRDPRITPENVNESEPGRRVNALWRELAAVHADVVNSMVQVIEPEEQLMAQAAVVAALKDSGMGLEEMTQLLNNDSGFRMMLRRSGIDPDRILRNIND